MAGEGDGDLQGLVVAVTLVTFLRRFVVNVLGIGGCGNTNPPVEGGVGSAPWMIT